MCQLINTVALFQLGVVITTRHLASPWVITITTVIIRPGEAGVQAVPSRPTITGQLYLANWSLVVYSVAKGRGKCVDGLAMRVDEVDESDEATVASGYY